VLNFIGFLSFLVKKSLKEKKYTLIRLQRKTG